MNVSQVISNLSNIGQQHKMSRVLLKNNTTRADIVVTMSSKMKGDVLHLLFTVTFTTKISVRLNVDSCFFETLMPVIDPRDVSVDI